MIETVQLTRRFGSFTAVDRVDLKVAHGEIFGFLGLNGAGKTTLMRMLCGLLKPTAGYCLIGGVPVRGPQDTHRLIPILSFVSQEMKFFERATLRELLGVYARLSSSDAAAGLAFALRAAVPLNRPCSTMSPGQQRKAQLAIALLKDPQYLLLDEPGAGLDPKGVAELRDIVRDLHRSGRTIFFSSHVLGEVQSVCTQVGILHQGKLRYQGSLHERYTFQIVGNVELALHLLRSVGLTADPAAAGVEVAVAQADVPLVVQRLSAAGVQTGLVQPVSLEHFFSHVIGEA